MSVTKFVRAQDILKEKGFKAPPFDTAAFQNAVVEFFRENDMSAKLTIRTMRFLDYKNAPKNPLFISTVPVVTHYVINEEEWEEEEDSWGEMIKYYTVNIERIENGEKTVSRSCISEEDLHSCIYEEYLDCEHPRIWDEYEYPYPKFIKDVIDDDSSDSPFIIIDEPYATNAIGLLKMLGFIVSRKRKSWLGRYKELKHHAYTVTLV